MLYVKRLSSVTSNELQAVGRKASDLALLSQQGIPAPLSFVVLSTAYDEMLRVNTLKYKIEYLLSHIQEQIPNSLVNVYNGARKAMLESKLPNGLEVELREAYNQATHPLAVGDLVATNDRVPVRIILSSNWDDDPESNDTIVQNVSDFAELLIAVREAWALAYHPTQLRARATTKFSENKVKVALLVQSMDKPGFTCHAYSCVPQDHQRTYIQTYAGYPDLRDKVEKDYYAVGKQSLRVIHAQTGRQQTVLERNASKELVLSPLTQHQDLLERDVLDVARLSRKAERILSTPVKAFFNVVDDTCDLLWVNRLGFDVIIRDEEQRMGSAAEESLLAPQPTAVSQPTAYSSSLSSVSESAASSASAPSEFLEVVSEPVQENLQQSLDAAAQAAAPAVDVQHGVAAKLLASSIRIVRQIVERKYRGAFGETPVAENLAQLIDRLNDASVFSRRVDGGLLLKAADAAHAEGTITNLEYAKVIEEVSYLMTYA